MYEVFERTAWRMELVKPYGLFHLSFLIIGLIISVFIAYKLRKINVKKLDKILFGIGIFLFIIESYKQLFYTFYIGEGSYQYWIFPFQLCSVPIYLCLLLPFIKNDKIKKSIYAFLISYNFLGGFISFLEPSGLIHEYYTLTIHAFIWHMTIVLIGLLISLNKNIKFKKTDFKYAFYMFLALCLVAFTINLILWFPSGKDINMFFVGPAISSLIVYKDIATNYGWYVNTIIYIISITIGAYIFYYPSTRKK